MRPSERARTTRIAHAVAMAWLREACFSRDHYTCQGYGVLDGRCAGELHAHHRLPRGQGGPDELNNLVTLCQEHHQGDYGVHGWRMMTRAYETELLIHTWAGPPDRPYGDDRTLPALGWFDDR